MPKQDASELLNRFILQVRYKANAKVLDFRGLWAEKISAHMKLSEWKIVENRVDVYTKDGQNRAFISFNDCGFVANDVPSKSYFVDQATRFFKFIIDFEGFDNPLYINRLGVRSSFLKPFKGTFDDLLGRYSSRFLKISDEVFEIMGAQVVDVGGPIYFKGDRCNFNTMSGPMKAEQAKQFLERSEVQSDLGLFFDIDYWRKPEQVVPNSDIYDFISKSSTESWDKFERIADLVLSA